MSEQAREMDRRAGHASKVVAHFRAHRGIWIDSLELERIGGRHAWRTRVSDARAVFCRELGWPFPVKDGPDPIQNRLRTVGDRMVSEYRYLEYVPLGRDAAEPIPAATGLLFDISPRA